MPKTPQTSPRKQRQSDGSPSKRSPRKKAQASEYSEQDKANWRPSRLGKDDTINKTDALKRYHLNEGNLIGLSRQTKTIVLNIRGVDKEMPMYLYNEREVELRAWEKHGGPEGFEKMLKDKEEKFFAKDANKGKLFKAKPTSYYSTEPMVYIFNAADFKHLPSPETATPTLLRIKSALAARGELWLWNAINKAIEDLPEMEYMFGPGIRREERESIVQTAFESLVDYPKRPTSPGPVSPSMKALESTLANAPAYNAKTHDADRRLSVHEDGFTGDISVEWAPSYMKEVYTRLSDVYKDHGMDGWEHARWLVYDKYSECNIGGLECYKPDDWQRGRNKYGWRWVDTADFWLEFDGDKMR